MSADQIYGQKLSQEYPDLFAQVLTLELAKLQGSTESITKFRTAINPLNGNLELFEMRFSWVAGLILIAVKFHNSGHIVSGDNFAKYFD